ncbi:MAG TPA: hypothetical protein VNB49_16495, partial [Candidatus Dormibacteraeota bacterium]|nr:hypothetical protein [Candidatus Dormibacteraeota bacterium]
HFEIDSSLLNGGLSSANCAKKIAGPLIVFMFVLSRTNSTGETAFYKIFALARTEFSMGARIKDVYSSCTQQGTSL